MSKFVYTGQDNLEAMKEAANYNSYLTDLLVDQINNLKKKNVKILDFGAGLGTYADMLKEKGIIVDCLELDQSQIKILKSKGYKVYTDLSKLKDQYDMIYSLNVFEHIEDDIATFRNLAKNINKNGIIFTYVPAMQIAFSSMDSLVGHYRRYDLHRLSDMANAAKLNTEWLGYVEPVGLVASVLYKLIGNKSGAISGGSVKFYDTFAFPLSRWISPLFKKLFGKNAILVVRKRN